MNRSRVSETLMALPSPTTKQTGNSSPFDLCTDINRTQSSPPGEKDASGPAE